MIALAGVATGTQGRSHFTALKGTGASCSDSVDPRLPLEVDEIDIAEPAMSVYIR